MRKLLVFLKDYKKETILGPLFKLLEASFELMVPLVIAAMINDGIKTGNKEYIIKMSIILVLLCLVGFISAVTAQFFAAKAATGFAKKVKRALFDNIQKLSYTDMDQIGTSAMITRMTTDVNQVQQGVNMTIRLLLRSPFVVLGAMVMAFTIDSRLALIFLVTIVLLSVVVALIMGWSIPRYGKIQAGLDTVLRLTRENHSGVRVIRAFGLEDREVKNFNKQNNALMNLQKFVGGVSALMNPLTFGILNLAVAFLIYKGAIVVNSGDLSQGDMVALYDYMSQILVELIKFANLILTITKAIASGNRVQELLELKSSMEDGSTDSFEKTSEHVVFKNVSMRYAGDSEDSLENVDLVVNRGEKIGVIGGTGSGKSTFINLIPRFYDAREGVVLFDGKDVRQYKLDALRDKIGIVPQKAVLFHGTIRDNIKWGKKDATDEEIYEALSIAQAKEIVDGKEGGLDFVVAQGGKNFSGGQKQRLTIARALVRKPEVLILDDSASALDYMTDKNLREAIANMPDPPTTFIVSQRTSAVSTCDKIVVLDNGKVVGIGKHDELLNSCDLYREIYDSQFKKEGAV
ncbi:ABC-type multidrug transport system, ATPase and permease component [Butyrivibrio hungatei DSM 14810]|uniref:ABC-type multidrug transport system, ATPase and permease component n=1 Tax=Butyrivibrio hungatei DSM 14810 TaxID=1121132 RepID=A0A1M7SBL1_9FIRM|nr:ABC transporter ATP-binding protein [Butyrivibrio hungatei]SHN55896.1 ABC-type multidrug transport system, ATPase and permease component [Butyrivibrio hungatei DSM 14810]